MKKYLVMLLALVMVSMPTVADWNTSQPVPQSNITRKKKTEKKPEQQKPIKKKTTPSNGGNKSKQDSANRNSTTKAKPKQEQAKPAPAPSPTPAPAKVTASNQTFTANGVSFTMVYVKGGTFTMGATSEQGNDAESDEKQHNVTLSDYYIGQTEVTQQLWQAVMGNNPSYFSGDSRRPVENVSWNDCQDFIRELNRITGQSFHLPTEAQWEYAARGGSKSSHCKYSGNHSIDNVAWYNGNSGKKTHPVATKQANELGIYDMSGNVWEWCADWYGGYSSGSQTNPTGSASGRYRVLRGGSRYDDAGFCRTSNRDCDVPTNCNGYGLRLAL